MRIFFEFKVNPETSYVPGSEIKSGDTVKALSGGNFAIFQLSNGEQPLSGLRLSSVDMDRLCQQWMDERRVCPFCKVAGMDVLTDENVSFGDVETSWDCHNCGALYERQYISGDVPWVDPIEGTRGADEDVHRRSGGAR